MKRNCEICNSEFNAAPANVKKGRGRFCSHPCYWKWLETRTGSKSPRWKGRTIEIECAVCKNKFMAKALEVENRGKKFCSRKCQHIGMERSPAKTRVDCFCLVCNKKFSKFQYAVNNGEGKCCSRKCMGIYRSEHYVLEKSPRWLGGKSSEPYPVEWKEMLRESIRERDGRKCVVCGIAESDRKHSVHHIDYNKDNLDPKNLTTLCVSCHSKTNSRRSYWMPYFKDIYQEQGTIL